MSVPFVAVKRWLDGRSEPDTFDVEGAREAGREDDKKQNRERAARPALAWRGEASEIIDAAGLRPGDTIVVPASYGGIASGTWAPAAEAAIVDIAEIAVLRQRGRGMLRLHPHARGLTFLPVGPVKTRAKTTGCIGGWKTGHFRWGLWTVPLGRAVVRSTVRLELDQMIAEERATRGIGVVFRCGIKRSDQGSVHRERSARDAGSALRSVADPGGTSLPTRLRASRGTGWRRRGSIRRPARGVPPSRSSRAARDA
jgi:hypothetical protein